MNPVVIPQANERALQEASLAFVDDLLQGLSDEVDLRTPREFCEAHRYLPESVSPRYPGLIRLALTPYLIEILQCFAQGSPVREVAVKKGVQLAYTTLLECVIFYLAGLIRTAPGMYVTADLGLSSARMTNNILPMFQHSSMGDIFRSADIGNSRKQGVTKAQLQWFGGGYLLPYGAQSAAKARQATILYQLLDELDGWPIEYLRDGDPIQTFKDRCAGVWPIRKILMGSTPLYEGSSHIDREFERGDQRVYKNRCIKCGFPQELRFSPPPAYEGKHYGLDWDFTEEGSLDLKSVRYHCINCQYPHMEHDKPQFINEKTSFWKPTAVPVAPDIRSYHIPAFVSPVGMQPWYKCVGTWLEAWDVKTKRVCDQAKMRVFYNNILGRSYRVSGDKLTFQTVSSHRRPFYKKGLIPNFQIEQACGSEILFLTCTIDAHHDNLAVAIWGWTAGFRCWLIDYYRLRDDSTEGCESLESPVWAAVSDLIESGVWEDDREVAYHLKLTLIDSGWSASTIASFCSRYESGVYPIKGAHGSVRGTGSIKDFSQFTTKIGTVGFSIWVDYYKDRLAPVLRRPWVPDAGIQDPYTFNAPLDTEDVELAELTVEQHKEYTAVNGMKAWRWERPSGSANELWDLMVYGHASVEIMAWDIMIRCFERTDVDWDQFWDYAREHIAPRLGEHIAPRLGEHIAPRLGEPKE